MVKIIKESQYITIQAEEESIVYQGKMMPSIPWLLPFEWENGKKLIYHKGEGLSLVEWLKKEKNEEEILEVLEVFLQNQRELEAYLIDEEKLIVDPDWIFWVKEKKMLRLAYIPWDMVVGVNKSFMKRFVRLLWETAILQQWQNEKLILMLYRMQIAVKHQDQPRLWSRWIEQEKRKIKERTLIKEQALDILTEEPEELMHGWFQRIKNKFPFAVR